jgi:uncharacterized protein (DUF2267 family)
LLGWCTKIGSYQGHAMTSGAFYKIVMETSHERSREVAKRATTAVFHALRDRLTTMKLSRAQFFERVRAKAKLATTRDAGWMTLAVLAALKEQLSPGEAEDVLAQLPKDLKELWTEAQVEVPAERRP